MKDAANFSQHDDLDPFEKLPVCSVPRVFSDLAASPEDESFFFGFFRLCTGSRTKFETSEHSTPSPSGTKKEDCM